MHFKQEIFRRCQSEGTTTEIIYPGKAEALENMGKYTPTSPALHFLLPVSREGFKCYWVMLGSLVGVSSTVHVPWCAPIPRVDCDMLHASFSYIPMNNRKAGKQHNARGRKEGTNPHFSSTAGAAD